MKKIKNSLLTNGIMAVLFGLVLIIWPQSSVGTLVIILGIIIAVFGLISIADFFMSRKESGGYIPALLLGVVYAVVGVFLITMPHFFVTILMYILAILLILSALYQLMFLWMIQKERGLSAWYYVIPLVVLVVGIVVLFNPTFIASFIMTLIGIASLLYGVGDLISWCRLRKTLK